MVLLAGNPNRFALDGGLSIAAFTNLLATTRRLTAEYEATIGARISLDEDELELEELDTQCHLGTAFLGATTRFNAWLERQGTPVTAGLVSCTVDFFNPTGVLFFSVTVLVADANGHFDLTNVGDVLTSPNPFYVLITIVDGEGTQVTHRTNPFTN